MKKRNTGHGVGCTVLEGHMTNMRYILHNYPTVSHVVLSSSNQFFFRDGIEDWIFRTGSGFHMLKPVLRSNDTWCKGKNSHQNAFWDAMERYIHTKPNIIWQDRHEGVFMPVTIMKKILDSYMFSGKWEYDKIRDIAVCEEWMLSSAFVALLNKKHYNDITLNLTSYMGKATCNRGYWDDKHRVSLEIRKKKYTTLVERSINRSNFFSLKRIVRSDAERSVRTAIFNKNIDLFSKKKTK
jgi:hypothetical protein